jgi:hypothetical protein
MEESEKYLAKRIKERKREGVIPGFTLYLLSFFKLLVKKTLA